MPHRRRRRDTLYNIERLEFLGGGEFINNTLAIGQPLISEADNSLTLGLVSPTETQQLTASPGNIDDANGLSNPNFSYVWQRSATGTLAGPWTQVGTGANYTPVQADVGFYLRVVATFTDDLGQVESRPSDATIIVGDFYNGTGAANTYSGGPRRERRLEPRPRQRRRRQPLHARWQRLHRRRRRQRHASTAATVTTSSSAAPATTAQWRRRAPTR